MSMDTLAGDIRQAGRTLGRSPGFVLVTTLTLALGIGATTAIFSVVDAVLLTPLPFAEAEQLVMVWEDDRLTGTLREAASLPDFLDFEEQNRSFEGMAAYLTREVNLSRDDSEPRRVTQAAVTYDMAAVLGVAVQMGRTIQADEDQPGGPRVALLSDAFWARGFGRDPAVLDRVLKLDDVDYTVVGVLPSGLDFPADADLWVPLQQSPATLPRHTHPIQVIARLSPATTIEAAQSDMTAIATRLEAEYPENRGRGVFVESLTDVLRGEARPVLLLLVGAVVAVLLIACANVANLLLVRGVARSQEMAVRVALGAGTWALARRFLVESLLLTGFAAVCGVGVAVLGLRGLLALAPAAVRDLGDVSLDVRVLLFTLTTSVLIAVGFSLVPLLQTLRLDLQSSLKDGRGSAGDSAAKLRLRRLLVVAQTFLAVVLLVGAGLLLTSLWKLRQVDPGFRTANVVRLDFRLPAARYPRDFSVWPHWTEVHGFNNELMQRLRALPGVGSAALAISHPLDPGFTNSFVIVGRESEAADQGELKTRLVSDGYFRTAGVALLEGRVFTDRDTADAPGVLLLNRTAQERYFPDSPAIGQRVRFWGIEREVVGIVADERMHGLKEATPPAMYAPLAQAPPRGAVTLMVRASGDPLQLVPALREAVWAIDRELAVYNVATMDETLAESLARESFASLLLSVFAILALGLALLGIHGVISYVVTLRHREVGLRMALGASRSRVMRMVLREGLVLAGAGIAAGLAVALAASRFVAALLYGVSPQDLSIYAGVAVLLAGAAVVACALPARRATRIDPASALRAE